MFSNCEYQSFWKSDHGMCCKAVAFLTKGISWNIISKVLLHSQLFKESCGKDDSIWEHRKLSFFQLNVISQWEGSLNSSNQFPLPQHVAAHSADHLTMNCVFSHLSCSFCSFCWTVEINKLIKYTGTRAYTYTKVEWREMKPCSWRELFSVKQNPAFYVLMSGHQMFDEQIFNQSINHTTKQKDVENYTFTWQNGLVLWALQRFTDYLVCRKP